MYCYNCGNKLTECANFCNKCGTKVIRPNYMEMDFSSVSEENEFNGIYKYDFWGRAIEVYCPRCGSSNCSHYKEQVCIPGKTKTRYTANLNPLKPFTLVNKKEKVIRKDSNYTADRILCNNCGKIF